MKSFSFFPIKKNYSTTPTYNYNSQIIYLNRFRSLTPTSLIFKTISSKQTRFANSYFSKKISRNDTIKHPTDFSNLPTPPPSPFNKLQLDAPVVLQRQEQDTRQIGSPFVRDSRLANELRERRVPSERDQQATGALQPAQVSPVCGGDPRHPAQVTLHPAPLVADLLGNLEQLVEVLEQYQVIGGGEDVPPLGQGRHETRVAALQDAPIARLAHRQFLLRGGIRGEVWEHLVDPFNRKNRIAATRHPIEKLVYCRMHCRREYLNIRME